MRASLARTSGWGVLAVTIEDTENDMSTNKMVATHVPVHNHFEALFPFIPESELLGIWCENSIRESQEDWYSSDSHGFVFVGRGEKSPLSFLDEAPVS